MFGLKRGGKWKASFTHRATLVIALHEVEDLTYIDLAHVHVVQLQVVNVDIKHAGTMVEHVAEGAVVRDASGVLLHAPPPHCARAAARE